MIRGLPLVLALASTLVLAQPASATDALRCVQTQLSKLNYDIGEPDGILGRKTRAASEAYRAEILARDPSWPQRQLEAANAVSWCRQLGADHSELHRYFEELVGRDFPAFSADFNLHRARIESLWDREYYLSQIPSLPAGVTPLTHYRTVGWKQGLDPSPWFDTSEYVAANPDLDFAGTNPLDQYIRSGMDELRGFGAVPDESGLIFEIGPGVTKKQEAIVREAMSIAHDYLEKHYGGDIPDEIRSHVTVKVDGEGKGYREPGSSIDRNGRGGNATGLSARNDLLPRPYLDFGHPDTNQNTSGRGWTQRNEQLSMVIHEYTHGWMRIFGNQSIYEQPLGNWINEGVATSVAISALADAGKMDRKAWDLFEMRAAIDTGEAAVPLKQFGSSVTKVWPGHIGYLAIEWLVAESPHGKMSLRILCEEVVRTNSVQQAFKAAFNIEMYEFYDQFEPWRQMILANPARAIAKRPALRNIGE